MRNPLRWSSTFPAVILSLAGVIGVVAGVVSIRGSLTTTGSVTAAGSLNVAPSTSATGFDAGPMDGATVPVPVVTAGSVAVLESAWDINDKTARTIGWRLRTEGAAGDSSNAPTTKLLIQSTADNSTWTTRATIDMTGALTVIRDSVANNKYVGLMLDNTTAATVGTTLQYSPMVAFRTSAWDTDGSSASLYWSIQATSVSSATPASYLSFASSTDGTTYTQRVYLDANGQVNATSLFGQTVTVGTEGDATRSYMRIDDGDGAPASTDCDADAETGRMIVDYTNDRLYICNQKSARGWDFIALTDS